MKTWDENPYLEFDGQKMTRASITNSFSGDLTGEGTVEYLMAYPNDAPVCFVGLHHVAGKLGERSGSFVLQATGTFANGSVQGAWFVVPGSATGDLTGLRGEGGYVSEGEQTLSITLDYSFD